jgi:hypothetical protein
MELNIESDGLGIHSGWELNASLLHELGGRPLSIHRLKLYWAGRESSFVRWHGGLVDDRSELIVNSRQGDSEGRKAKQIPCPACSGARSGGLSTNPAIGVTARSRVLQLSLLKANASFLVHK